MSSQFARLKHALNRAETTSVGPVQVTVFADDLHSILAHYITVSTELAELKAASATEVCAVIPSIREYVESLESRLAQVRRDALEEAAEYFQLNDTNLFWGSQAAREVRALKDIYTNPRNLDTSEKRVQIIHDSIHEAIQPDIEGHPV